MPPVEKKGARHVVQGVAADELVVQPKPASHRHCAIAVAPDATAAVVLAGQPVHSSRLPPGL